MPPSSRTQAVSNCCCVMAQQDLSATASTLAHGVVWELVQENEVLGEF